jgi:hypothetical protein
VTIDPLSLGVFERLEKYPDSYTDEQLRELTSHYEGQHPRGRNARIPAMAFLILEEREKNRYTKEEK